MYENLETLDLFNNPVGYFTSLAISRPGAALWGCKIAFFSGSCLTTEVIKQLYCMFAAILAIFGIIPACSGGKEEETLKKFMPPEGFDKKINGIAYGNLKEIEYYSKTTGANRKCYVYTPPGYNTETTYPVLYLLHGIGGTHAEWLDGNPNEILSNLIASGEMPPVIAVMPNIRAKQNDTDMSDMFGQEHIAAFDNFINDLRDDLMPFIKREYKVSNEREKCAIAGLSMGGRESLFIGISMPQTFGYTGAFSPAPGLSPGQLSVDKMTLSDEYKNNTFILINNGNQDTTVNNFPFDYHKILEDNGVPHTYYTIDGGHDFEVWKNGLYNFARRIFKGDTA